MLDIDNRIEEKLLYLSLLDIDVSELKELYDFRKSYTEKYNNFVFLEDYTFPCYTVKTRYYGYRGDSISDLWKSFLPVTISGNGLTTVLNGNLESIMDFKENETSIEDILAQCKIDNEKPHCLSNDEQTQSMSDILTYGKLSFPSKQLAQKFLINSFQENIDSLKLFLSE